MEKYLPLTAKLRKEPLHGDVEKGPDKVLFPAI